MIRRFFSSLNFLQFLLLSLSAVTLMFLWGLYFQQKAVSRQEALAAKAAEHLNLATITAENLSQLVDRAQAIGRVARRDQDEGNWTLVRMLAEDPVLKRMSLYDRDGSVLTASHPDEPLRLPAP